MNLVTYISLVNYSFFVNFGFNYSNITKRLKIKRKCEVNVDFSKNNNNS